MSWSSIISNNNKLPLLPDPAVCKLDLNNLYNPTTLTTLTHNHLHRSEDLKQILCLHKLLPHLTTNTKNTPPHPITPNKLPLPLLPLPPLSLPPPSPLPPPLPLPTVLPPLVMTLILPLFVLLSPPVSFVLSPTSSSKSLSNHPVVTSSTLTMPLNGYLLVILAPNPLLPLPPNLRSLVLSVPLLFLLTILSSTLI